MALKDHPCPTCHTKGSPSFSGLRISLAPTGGDYDWIETDAKAHCKHCGHSYDVRVQYDLDLQKVVEITRVYKH